MVHEFMFKSADMFWKVLPQDLPAFKSTLLVLINYFEKKNSIFGIVKLA